MPSSDLENFYAITEHRRPSRILYYANLSDDLHKQVTKRIGTSDYKEYFGFFTPVDIWPQRPKGIEAPDYSKYYCNDNLPPKTTFNRVGVAKIPCDFHHFTRFLSPLRNAKTLSEIENYFLEDMTSWNMEYMSRIVEKAHAKGKVVRGLVVDMYEPAWQIRGYEQFLMDMIDKPAWAQCLLDRIAEQNLIRATAYAKAGVDWILCGDDVANQQTLMFSRQTWKNLIHSRWKKIWHAVHEINPKTKIWYHSDGNITEIAGDLIEDGVNILNPLQPECVDTNKIHSLYGKKVTFDGCIGTQTTMPFGTPDDVRQRVKQLIEKYSKKGGLIVSPTHLLEPEVPIENIEAFTQACRDFGNFE
jgi:uroporphyrinogen decarboxylase